jgi:CHAT domain-containing protein
MIRRPLNTPHGTWLILAFLLAGFRAVSFGQTPLPAPTIVAKSIPYEILSGQQAKADSSLTELEKALAPYSTDTASQEVLYNLRCLYSVVFHYDYALDSLHRTHLRRLQSPFAHIQTFIESEFEFNHADWEKASNFAFDFSIQELEADPIAQIPLLHVASIANIIICRDNILQNVDTSISNHFIELLQLMLRNSPDSLAPSLLIKFYWASCIIDASSALSIQLKAILWGKIRTLSMEDLAYFESLLGTYSIDKHTYYQKRNNNTLYEDITGSLLTEPKSYFVQNKWLFHLLQFGLFGDSEDEDKYISIERAHYPQLKTILPYYQGRRFIDYGIHYGPIDKGTSIAYFNRFYYNLSGDSSFKHCNFRLLPYASFEDLTYSTSPDDGVLVNEIESTHMINRSNSPTFNYLVVEGYINQLALEKKFTKIDSLFQLDSIIASFRDRLEEDAGRQYMRLANQLASNGSVTNYTHYKDAYIKLLKNVNNAELLAVTIPDVIEYATFYTDLSFADSLLTIYRQLADNAISRVAQLQIPKSSIAGMMKNYYVERSYLNLYNSTRDPRYLQELLSFALQKEARLQSVLSFHSHNSNAIESLQSSLFRDEMIKSYKMVTHLYQFALDFDYFEKRKMQFNLAIDALTLSSDPTLFKKIDSPATADYFLPSLSANTILLMGLASRKHPRDQYLTTYVLLIQKEIHKLQLVEIEDSLFTTKMGNWLAAPTSPYTKKDQFRLFLANLSASPGIHSIQTACIGKDTVLIADGALIDQIPFNILLSTQKNSFTVHNFVNLASTITGDTCKARLFAQSATDEVLCLGGAEFAGRNIGTTMRLWNDLPGTLEEVNFIHDLLKNDSRVTLLTKQKATKANFMTKLYENNYQLLHLATHSFYADFDSTQNPFSRIPVSILPQREIRSCILFSNAAQFEQYDSVRRLTAFLDNNLTLGEILYLPLQHTKLVVLSSCETNVGLPQTFLDFYGNMTLSTAFKYAGARYVLGTRWEISDAFAKSFFKYFYEELKKSLPIERSFDEAVKRLREQTNDPYIWGAFILIK